MIKKDLLKKQRGEKAKNMNKKENLFIPDYDRNLFHLMTPDNIIFTYWYVMHENYYNQRSLDEMNFEQKPKISKCTMYLPSVGNYIEDLT